MRWHERAALPSENGSRFCHPAWPDLMPDAFRLDGLEIRKEIPPTSIDGH